MTEYLECDDMLEGEEICAGDMDYCENLRWRCKKADDFYFKKDGYHYYQRFITFTQREYNFEEKKIEKQCFLRDQLHEFEDIPLADPEDAQSLIRFLYQLCDKIDELGGNSEWIR